MDVVSVWDRIYEVLQARGVTDDQLVDDLHDLLSSIIRNKVALKEATDLEEIYRLSMTSNTATYRNMFASLKAINDLIFVKLQKIQNENTQI